MISSLKSSLGKKYLMALTGLALIGFVIAHLLGNLQVFLGPDALNSYAEALANLGALLWVARLGLLFVFITHLGLAFRLTYENKKARDHGYQYPGTIKATLTSRTMIISGLLILGYVIYHLMHFTFQTTHPEFAGLVDAKGRHDVYQMVISGFSEPAIAFAYLFSMIMLAAHLHHGASSVFQSLGLNGGKYRCLTKWFGPALAALVIIGYGSIPLAVQLGILK